MGQIGVRGVHSSKPLVDADPAGPGPTAPLYSKADVGYGPAKGEKECAGCRFFYKDAGGMCRLVKGAIDDEAWCQLYSPIDVKDLERTGSRLTESQLTKFYELKHVRLADVQGARASWVPIFPEGTFYHPEYGTLDFTLPELKKYVMHFRQRVRKIDIAVDIDHKNEEAVGWLKDLDLRPGIGLFGLVEWNQHGAGLIADKRYRYISPQFGEYVDEESGQSYDPVLVALTITNFPFLKSMTAIGLRKKEGGSPVTGNRMPSASTSSTRLKKAMGVPDKGAKRADDDELDDDAEAKRADDDTTDLKKGKKAVKAKRAKKADDDELMDGDSDDAFQSSELDEELDDDEASEKLYDEDDLYRDESADQFEGQTRGDTRPESVSKGKPGAYDAPRGGRSSAEPKDTIRRLAEENRKKDRRLAVLEEQMRETNRVMRLGSVREQTRKLMEPQSRERGDKVLSVTFTRPVIAEFRALALADKKAGDALFRILSIVRKDGLVNLSTEGRADDPEDESNDPTGRGTKVLRDKKTGRPVAGTDDQRKAMMYAKEHKLEWDSLEDRQKAYLATMYGDGDVQLSDESGYGRDED